MTILVTGAAGFIGFQLARKLLQKGQDVVGLDNMNDYYDVSLKEARLRELEEVQGFRFMRLDIAEGNEIDRLFAAAKFDVVINLAAQAGVRYSLVNPHAYVRSNIEGFVNVLEACRRHEVRHLIYASSSSVYGAVTKMPFSVHQNVDHPVSVYGATKKANELMAHSYSHLFGLPTTGLRFFTVYGPWGRPDMALFLFTRNILAGTPVELFNNGDHIRDFTYIDDIVEGLVRVLKQPPPPRDPAWNPKKPDPASSSAPWRIYNIGNSQPTKLTRYIEVLEECLGRKAEKKMLPMQAGDVHATFADVSELTRDFGYKPS